jgi:dTDP-4-dehydrorhamnose reductase
MKILVTGKGGQLGKAFQEEFLSLFQDRHSEVDIRYIGRQECDLTDLDALEKILRDYQPDVIINAAAYTAVDKAEQEGDLVFAINAAVAGLMARYAASNGAYLLHYSTDYVFDGEGSDFYTENHPTAPLGVYGKNKAEGERLILEAFSKIKGPQAHYAIFRTSWVYGDGSNFIRTILRLAKDQSELKAIADQFGVPTSAEWLAALSTDFLLNLSSDSSIALIDFPSGIYHAVPAGETTWYGLVHTVIEAARATGVNLSLEASNVKAIPAAEYPLPAPRPMNSRLSNLKLRETLEVLGIETQFPEWDQLVRSYVSDLVKNQLISRCRDGKS